MSDKNFLGDGGKNAEKNRLRDKNFFNGTEPEDELDSEPANKNTDSSDQDYGGSKKPFNKKLWIIIGIAAVAAIVLIIALIIVPMNTEPERPERTPVPSASETPAPEPSLAAAESAAASKTPEPKREILADLKELYKENNDLAGWLTIPDTVIDYPVMYTKEDDGEFYLYRTFYKEQDPTKEGCLFIDENCSIDPRSTNLLIHGHNMKNGTMFHSLLDYADEEYYKEHPIINYSSLWEDGEYEIVAVFRSKVYNKDDDVFKFYKFYNATNEKEFNDFIENIKKLELYDTGVKAEYGDELITLATCEYTVENGRFVVVARKKTD